jgi:hypothetical protein
MRAFYACRCCDACSLSSRKSGWCFAAKRRWITHLSINHVRVRPGWEPLAAIAPREAGVDV